MCVEFFKILLLTYVSSAPSALMETRIKLMNNNKQLSRIKSVQVEFVRHSKLRRKSILLEKKVEDLNKTTGLLIESWRDRMSVIRLVIYFGFMAFILYNFPSRALLDTRGNLLWPWALVTFDKNMSVGIFQGFLFCFLASRHCVDTARNLIGTRSEVKALRRTE